VTCGGLCPGLNSVIRSLVITLAYTYGCSRIKGFKFGYEGLDPDAKDGSNWMWLDPKVVESIHHFGGSLIGTSRGPQSVQKMVQCLRKEQVSILFTIGGDGTLRGTKAICDEIAKEKLRIAVIGIPKTIDNDVPLTEVSV
jgi:6-phosphofructokinase 1